MSSGEAAIIESSEIDDLQESPILVVGMRDILRAVLKTGTGSLASLSFGIIATKVFAVMLGPVGVGLYSLVRQIEQTALLLGSLSGNTPLVQGMASRTGKERASYLFTVLCLFLLGSALACLSLFLWAPNISSWVLGHDDISTVMLVRWITLPLLLDVMLIYISSVLNGYRAVGRLALVQVINSGVSAVLAYPMAKLVGVGYWGAFIWMMSVSSGSAVVLALFFTWRQRLLGSIFREGLKQFNWLHVRSFFLIAWVTLVTSLAETGKVLVIRSLVVGEFGLSGAGVFDAAWTLSMRYVTLVLSSFATYYLPTLSQTYVHRDRVNLIQRTLRLSTLMMVPLVVGLIVLKPLVITILYSGEFSESIRIMRWMLIADYLKATSFVLAYLMLAFPDMKAFFWSEMIAKVWLLMFAAMSTRVFQSMEGIGIGFVLLHIGYLIFTFTYAKIRFQFIPDRTWSLQWLIGLVLIVGASLQTWNASQVNLLTAVIWLVAASAFSVLSVGRSGWVSLWRLLPANRVNDKKDSGDSIASEKRSNHPA